MMERRQIWLEEQFLQQGKDLLRLSRQIHVIQDFITLHFDSFRDYIMERERGDIRMEEKGTDGISVGCDGGGGGSRFNSLHSRPLSPYESTAHSHNVSFRIPSSNIEPNNSISGIYDNASNRNVMDNPVDLSEYPSSSDFVEQRPISPLDLSVSSSNWDGTYAKNQVEDESLRNLSHHQSPSPILSRSSLPHDATPEGFHFKSEMDLTDRESSEEDENGAVTYPHSSSSRSSLHPNPRLATSPYDSVLRSILRTDPPVAAKIKYEQVNANLPMRPYESSQQLHWSSGTVTSSANATPSSAPSIFAESGNYGHNEPDSAVLGLVGLGVKIKREDGAIEYERQGRDCSNSIELGRLLPSSNFDSPPVSKSEPEDYSNAKTKGKKPRRPKSSTSLPKTSLPKKSKSRQGRNTSTPNSGGTVESSSSSNQGTKKCRFCGKTFQWSHSVKTHERLHTGDKPYLCKMCGTRFTQNGNLKVHAKTCVGKYAEMYKSKNIYVCPLCTEMFQSMDELMAHQKSHDRMQWSDKDKTCRYCGKMFQKRSLLLAHELIHTQDDEDDNNDEDGDRVNVNGDADRSKLETSCGGDEGSQDGRGGDNQISLSSRCLSQNDSLQPHSLDKEITMVPCIGGNTDMHNGEELEEDSSGDDSD